MFLDATTCPDDFDLVEGGCYKMSADVATFEEARASCQSLPGDYDLAILNSNALTTHFAQTVLEGKTNCWIGLHDLSQEGKFEWVDGTLSEFTAGEAPWNSGEPNVSSELSLFFSEYSLILITLISDLHQIYRACFHFIHSNAGCGLR